MKFDDVRAAIVEKMLTFDGSPETQVFTDIAGILAAASRDMPEK